ncbi:MAG: hypothetical protein RIB57_14065 [Pelagibacterium sp.]|uniref:SecDF P1 head subdomain-containing protein n=1 Tax=Pelagibacterium sp. TaxID=1967288 RepID=UPI0032ED14FB
MRKALFAASIAVSAWLSPGGAAMAETLTLDIEDAAMVVDNQTDRPTLHIHLNAQSAKMFGDLTIRHISSVVEVSLEGKVLTSPRIQSPILEGSLQITGDFSEAEVEAMVERINSGAQLEVRVVDE